MEVTRDMIRELSEMPLEEFEAKRIKGNFVKNNRKTDEVFETLKNQSKRIFGLAFDDIKEKKETKNLKRGIKNLLGNSSIDSFQLCNIPEKRMCHSGK